MATEVITRHSASGSKSEVGGSVPSRALAKGLEMVDLVSASSLPLSLGELAGATRLGKPSALRLLQTLCSLGYLEKDEDGSYGPGPRMPGQPAGHFTEQLVSAASPDMLRLNHDLAETVTLAALYDDHIRVVHTLESSHHIRMSNHLNRILPPYASSLGKAIAAFQAPERVQQLIQVFGLYQITDKTITNPVKIREHLAEVRANGYALEVEETVIGGCCFGAPIVEKDGRVRAAVSVSMPATRCSPRMKEVVPARVSEAAAGIAKKLSGRIATGR